MSDWIKCSERLPELGEKVLLYIHSLDEIRIGHREYSDEWSADNVNGILYKNRHISHWMPLPPLPEPPR